MLKNEGNGNSGVFSSSNTFPPIALTAGDPEGISGEITLTAWNALRKIINRGFFLIADIEWICPIAKQAGVPIAEIKYPEEVEDVFPSALPVLACYPNGNDECLRLLDNYHQTSRSTSLEIASILKAASLTYEGKAAAMVTNPINKKKIQQEKEYGDFNGHTSFLRDIFKTKETFMMMLTPELCVTPVTLHVSLKDAISKLNQESIIQASLLTADLIRSFKGIKKPKICVSGLNPHCGEGGIMGTEEEEIIIPALKRLQEDYNLPTFGPFSADAMFTESHRKTYDAAICMYHDQALIAPKTLSFMECVNITLGLPIIRTSPGHGVAYDIAGQWKADARSLCSAIVTADKIYNRAKKLEFQEL